MQMLHMSLTKSKTFAANIRWLKENKNIKQIKVLMVNSGNANAYTGKQGYSNLKKLSYYLLQLNTIVRKSK